MSEARLLPRPLPLLGAPAGARDDAVQDRRHRLSGEHFEVLTDGRKADARRLPASPELRRRDPLRASAQALPERLTSGDLAAPR